MKDARARKRARASKKLSDSRDRLVALVAQLHVMGKEPMTQSDIAKRLEIDKATVSRLLGEAHQKGIVTYSLHLPRQQDVETRLIRLYGLVEAVAVPVMPPKTPREAPAFRRHLAEAAAQHLEGEGSPIRNGQKVGISCGATIRDLIIALTPGRVSGMHISQLTIETECDSFLDTTSFTLVGMLLAKWRDNTDTSSAYAIQPLPDSLRGADLKWEEKYKTHWNVITGKARELDVAIVGIGSPEVGKGGGTFAQILKTHGVDPKKLKDKGMAGEICNRPFDSDGRDLMEVDDIILSFLDGVELGVLKELVDKKRKVIAVAGGANKTDAIRVALRKGLVNYLITDVHTGEELCDLA